MLQKLFGLLAKSRSCIGIASYSIAQSHPGVILTVLFFTLTLPAFAQTAPYDYLRIGNSDPARGNPRPGFALMGGGTDLDEAFRWLCDRAGGGDFLILRASGSAGYNPYVAKLCKLNSVATLILPSSAAANDAFVARKIREASALFIAGGDQANYINFWMNSPLQAALNEAIARGVPVGGTSAGLAVMGEYVYSAQGDKPDDHDLDSRTAMDDTTGPRVRLVQQFLSIPILSGTITDTHFARRDRMGRLLVFLARLKQSGNSTVAVHSARGIGVDEGAAILLDPDGHASVVGSGRGAWFVDASRARGTLAFQTPLTFGPCDVTHVAPGHTFDLKSWSGDGSRYSLQVETGEVHSTQPNSSIY